MFPLSIFWKTQKLCLAVGGGCYIKEHNKRYRLYWSPFIVVPKPFISYQHLESAIKRTFVINYALTVKTIHASSNNANILLLRAVIDKSSESTNRNIFDQLEPIDFHNFRQFNCPPIHRYYKSTDARAFCSTT